MAADLDKGRTHYQNQEWAAAFDSLTRAQESGPLGAEDLERLVWAAGLIGDDDAFVRNLERLYQVHVDASRANFAARSAFWLAFRLMSLGSSGQAAAWFARAERLLEDVADDCPERGYMMLPLVFRFLSENDNEAAADTARNAAAIGARHHDADLAAIARNLEGRALLRLGESAAGFALIDEAMLAVTSGDVSPLICGIVYCNVIATCNQVYAVDRAREWTEALSKWIGQQPQLVNFTGACLVHRSEVLQLTGEWADAYQEVSLVCDGACKDRDPEVFADACYQQAELLRLQGQHDDAEQAYLTASRNGRDPQPGLALLRLAQGRSSEAVGAIERAMTTTQPAWQRARLLPAYFEIMHAAGDHDRARDAAAELADIGREFGTEILGALAAQTEGQILLDTNQAREAAECLRSAFTTWKRAGAPYLAARVRVLLAIAYRALGDNDGASLELDAARVIFEELGALPDLESLPSGMDSSATCGLSDRELEVLRLVARGMTNKAIAAMLGLSDRTIDRHVSNIFDKLNVTTRAAATAMAYELRLIHPTG